MSVEFLYAKNPFLTSKGKETPSIKHIDGAGLFTLIFYTSGQGTYFYQVVFGTKFGDWCDKMKDERWKLKIDDELFSFSPSTSYFVHVFILTRERQPEAFVPLGHN